MMLFNFFVVFYIVCADVIRDDGYHDYEGQFTVMNKGRMLRVLMFFNNVQREMCALHCVRHLRCRTFNYHHEKKNCELTDENYNEMNVDIITPGWYNYGTPPKVNGGWSAWRNVTGCTKKCGSGRLNQWRNCDSPEPEHGGTDCKGRMTRRIRCNTHRCVVDCAPAKAVKQSSTYKGHARRLPEVATDGLDSTYSSTNLQNNPWWEIDLAEVREIEDVYLRVSLTYGNYNHHLFVEIRKMEVDSWLICKEIGKVKTQVLKFKCNVQPTNARFLRIRSQGKSYLSIYLVKIFAYENN